MRFKPLSVKLSPGTYNLVRSAKKRIQKDQRRHLSIDDALHQILTEWLNMRTKPLWVKTRELEDWEPR